MIGFEEGNLDDENNLKNDHYTNNYKQYNNNGGRRLHPHGNNNKNDFNRIQQQINYNDEMMQLDDDPFNQLGSLKSSILGGNGPADTTGITGRYAMMRGSQTQNNTVDQGANLTESGQSMKTQTIVPFKARYRQE